jgi:hypothetical protein
MYEYEYFVYFHSIASVLLPLSLSLVTHPISPIFHYYSDSQNLYKYFKIWSRRFIYRDFYQELAI